MAKNDEDSFGIEPDDDDSFRKKRSRRRPENEDNEEDEDDYRDKRRIRRRREEGDVTGGVIPYKNPSALTAYYCGVFGLISCFLCLGIFGVVPIFLGMKGLQYAKQHPEARGQTHAIVGIVLGITELLSFLGLVGLGIAAVFAKK